MYACVDTQAAGMIKVPFLPRIDDIQLYKGEYLHSSHYTTGAAFQGKRVLIVGCNNSAVEIATDLHEHRAQPTLILRTGSFFNFVHHQAVMNVQNAGVRWGGLMRLLGPVTWLVCNFYLGLYNYLYCGDLSKYVCACTRASVCAYMHAYVSYATRVYTLRCLCVFLGDKLSRQRR